MRVIHTHPAKEEEKEEEKQKEEERRWRLKYRNTQQRCVVVFCADVRLRGEGEEDGGERMSK